MFDKEIKIATIFEDEGNTYVYSFAIDKLVYSVTFLHVGNKIYNIDYILYSDGEDVIYTSKPYTVGYRNASGVLAGLFNIIMMFVDKVKPNGVEFRVEDSLTDSRLRMYKRMIKNILKSRNIESQYRVGTVFTITKNNFDKD